jgi:hypothetical protein
MDFISGLYSMYLKDRFGEIQNYGEDASDIQSEQLSNLLLEAADTEWGKKFDFKTIFSYQEFRERIPVQYISDLEPFLQRMKKGEANLLWPGLPKDIMLSINETKVPLFLQAVEEIFLQGFSDSLAIYFQNYPQNKLLEGYSANVGNGTDFPFMNELYAQIRDNEPFLSSLLNLPKRVGTDKDGDPSAELVLQEAIEEKVTSFRGNPKKFELLLNRALKKTGKSNLHEIWPDAEVLFERGPQKTADLESCLNKLPKGIKYQASYMSPEGFFGIQDDLSDLSFLLMIDISTFYEFIPYEASSEAIIPLEDVEIGEIYQMVLSNCNGLWRCCSEGPLVRFVSKNPFRFILM